MAKPIRYVHAVAQALKDAMSDDPSVIVLGEDVAAAGGPFKATRGLLDTFARRFRNYRSSVRRRARQ
jgi:acetoin:2,6-dichlorophenolindophenol oxidoreductase subunit beta